jgi:hypothetical protein
VRNVKSYPLLLRVLKQRSLGMQISSSIRWMDPKSGERVVYAITPADVLTVARAAAHEGDPTRLVVWTWLQRFAMRYPRDGSLSALVSAHSQPINPRWFPSGDLHQREVLRLQRNPRLSEEDIATRVASEQRRASRRLRYARATWESLNQEIRREVLRILSGDDGPSPFPGSVDFRASVAARGDDNEEAHRKALRWLERWNNRSAVEHTLLDSGHGYRRGVNIFFGRQGWPLFTVEVGPDPKVPSQLPPSC